MSEELRHHDDENEDVRAELTDESAETLPKERESFMSREMQMLRSLLARFGLTLMYLAGLTIVGLSVYQAFFEVRDYETTLSAINQLLMAGAGGFVMAATTWLWMKIVK